MWKYWWGWFLLEGVGTWPFMVRMVKGLQHQIFLNNGSFTSESVSAFRFCSCPGPFLLWRGETLVPGVI